MSILLLNSKKEDPKSVKNYLLYHVKKPINSSLRLHQKEIQNKYCLKTSREDWRTREGFFNWYIKNWDTCKEYFINLEKESFKKLKNQSNEEEFIQKSLQITEQTEGQEELDEYNGKTAVIDSDTPIKISKAEPIKVNFNKENQNDEELFFEEFRTIDDHPDFELDIGKNEYF